MWIEAEVGQLFVTFVLIKYYLKVYFLHVHNYLIFRIDYVHPLPTVHPLSS